MQDDLTEIKISLANLVQENRYIRSDVKEIKRIVAINSTFTNKNRMQIALILRDAKWRAGIVASIAAMVGTTMTLLVEWIRGRG